MYLVIFEDGTFKQTKECTRDMTEAANGGDLDIIKVAFELVSDGRFLFYDVDTDRFIEVKDV